jgi:hypothetical protein
MHRTHTPAALIALLLTSTACVFPRDQHDDATVRNQINTVALGADFTLQLFAGCEGGLHGGSDTPLLFSLVNCVDNTTFTDLHVTALDPGLLVGDVSTVQDHDGNFTTTIALHAAAAGTAHVQVAFTLNGAPQTQDASVEVAAVAHLRPLVCDEAPALYDDGTTLPTAERFEVDDTHVGAFDAQDHQIQLGDRVAGQPSPFVVTDAANARSISLPAAFGPVPPLVVENQPVPSGVVLDAVSSIDPLSGRHLKLFTVHDGRLACFAGGVEVVAADAQNCLAGAVSDGAQVQPLHGTHTCIAHVLFVDAGGVATPLVDLEVDDAGARLLPLAD